MSDHKLGHLLFCAAQDDTAIQQHNKKIYLFEINIIIDV